MANRLFLTNDVDGSKEEVYYFFAGAEGNITADATIALFGPAPCAGTIVGGYLGCVMGVDATNALSLELDVLINDTSVWTTKPKIDKTAGNAWKTTFSPDTTKVIAGVLDSTKVAVAQGNKIHVVADITRTASPSTEITDWYAVVLFKPTAV